MKCRVVVGLCLAACGGAATEAPKTGPKPPDDDARVAAFRAEWAELSERFSSCHAQARLDRFAVAGRLVVEVSGPREGESGTTVQVVDNQTGSDLLGTCVQEVAVGHSWSSLAPDESVRMPIDFPALGPNYAVHAAQVTPVQPNEALRVAILLDEQNSGNTDASLSLVQIAKDVPWHRHPTSEAAFVLGGEGVLYDRRGRNKGVPLRPGTATFTPANAPHGYVHKSDEPLLAIVLYAPAGAEQRFADPKLPGSEAMTAAQARKDKKASKPLIRSVAKAKSLPLPREGGEVRIVLDEGAGASVSVAAMTIRAEAAVPPHRHETSSEYLYIIEGGGVLTVQGVATEVGAGAAIQIPKNAEHSFQGGAATTKAVQFYVPAGPEQRFKKAP